MLEVAPAEFRRLGYWCHAPLMAQAPDSNPTSSPTGLLSSAKRLVRTAAAVVHNRFEFLVVGLHEEGVRLLQKRMVNISMISASTLETDNGSD